MLSSDGDIYIGNFVKSKKEGYGKLIYSIGKTEEGMWKMDKFIGN